MAPQITFDKSATELVLKQFDKTVDEEGYIIEDSENGDRVLTPEGEEIKKSELAGVAEGSQVFVEDNFVSLINFAKGQK